jgi:hypothetical protein
LTISGIEIAAKSSYRSDSARVLDTPQNYFSLAKEFAANTKNDELNVEMNEDFVA